MGAGFGERYSITLSPLLYRCTMDRYRRWMWTHFPTMEVPPIDLAEVLLNATVKYVAFGWEWTEGTAEDPCRLHQQGYVELATATRLGGLKPLFHPTTHFDACRGTQAQCLEYCKKAGEFSEAGTKSHQGQSREADDLFQRVRNGETLSDLLSDMSGHAYFQYAPGILRLTNFLAPNRNSFARLLFHWGPAGAGKSFAAFSDGAHAVDLVGSFFNGFNTGMATLCFDEFEPSECPRKLFLRICDRHPFAANVKCATANFAPGKIYFTSIDNPRNWVFKCGNGWDDQCERRLTESGGEIKEFFL